MYKSTEEYIYPLLRDDWSGVENVVHNEMVTYLSRQSGQKVTACDFLLPNSVSLGLGLAKNLSLCVTATLSS